MNQLLSNPKNQGFDFSIKYFSTVDTKGVARRKVLCLYQKGPMKNYLFRNVAILRLNEELKYLKTLITFIAQDVTTSRTKSQFDH